MATRKLRFVASAPTGEDPKHPASDLVTRGAKACGWQSPRHCTYPQHLILDLADGPARVATLQLLAHEAKIATRVDVAVTIDPPPATPGAAAATQRSWRRLGALTFDANERSDHAARELKSVAVNEARVTALRMTLHEPHTVPPHLNAGRQVGIVAVNVVGEREGVAAAGEGAAVVAVPVDDGEEGSGGGRAAAVATAAAATVTIPDPSPPPPLCSDPETAAKLADLAAAKAAAAAAEDYDGAKKAKAAFDALKAVAAALDELAARKVAAVAAEDYDAAKRIKAEMERVKKEGRREGGGGGGEAPAPAPVRTASADPWDQRPVKQADGGAHTPQPPASSPPALPLRWGYDAAKRLLDAGDGAAPPTHPLSADDRSASAGSAPPAALEAGPAPPDWPADLPAPDALTDADLKELGTVVPWAGPYASAALRSKAWALRDAGLTYLVARMKAGGASDADAGDRREWTRCVARVLASAVGDRVPAVAVAAATAVTACVACLAAAPTSTRDATVIASEALPMLVDRTTDGNARVAAAAAAAVTHLARSRSLPLSFNVAVKSGSSNAPPKAVAARLALLAELLPVVRVSGGEADASSPSSSPHHPLDATAAMKLAVAGLTSSSADVRASAVLVAAAVAVRAGGGVLALIPADVNPKLKAAVVEAAVVEGGGGVGCGAAAAAPAAPRRKAPTPTRAAAAKKAAPPPKKVGAAITTSTKQDVAVRAGSVDGAGPAAPPPPSLHATPPPLPLPTSDPAPYEAELASREAALGPAHPRVADALCALAAVHTARGERGAAQRLLGRALGVYEAACGPDSTDAAAALTDLGVLHLEAGEDGVGRPLLACALAIQEAALGRDHPDAVAIRAVLEAE